MPGVQLLNVHALGGTAMLQAAVQAVSAGVAMGADRPRLLAVTILTSMDKILVLNAGNVERFGTRDEVLGSLVRPVVMPTQRPAVAAMASSRQGGDG